MTIALVQSASGGDSAPTLPGATSAGGIVIVGVGALNGSITCTGFTNVGGFQRMQSSDVGVMYFRKVLSSGDSGVYALSGSAPWVVAEFSNVDDGGGTPETATNTQQDGSFPAGASHWTQSLTTPGSGEVLVVSAFAWNNQTNGVDGTWDSPFTNIDQVWHSATSKAFGLGYHIDATDDGSYTSGMTNTTPSISYWGHVIASYAGGAGGGGGARSQSVIVG